QPLRDSSPSQALIKQEAEKPSSSEDAPHNSFFFLASPYLLRDFLSLHIRAACVRVRATYTAISGYQSRCGKPGFCCLRASSFQAQQHRNNR
ncbi:unnamed protein product, partial [Ectocarpus fasciculatus]